MSTEIAVMQQPGQLATVEAPGSSALAAIMRAAQDPNTDVAKMETLISLYERMQDRTAKQRFNEAMVACQAEMPRISRDGRVINHKTNQLQSRYATYERIDEIVRPIYSDKYGFAISVSIGMPENGKYPCTAIVRHRDGHSEPFTLPLALDQSGAKNDTQGMGSTQSYARRYLVCGIFNIVTEGQDTDGAPPKADPPITQAQADDLQTVLTDRKTNMAKFYERVSTMAGHEVTQLSKIPARLYPQIMTGFQGAK